MKPGLIAALQCITGLALLPATYLAIAGCSGHSTAVAGPPQTTRARHPDVAGEQECATCHRPDLRLSFKAWEDSPHGLALVKCVVCHGSTGADYKPKPDSRTCVGCHAAQVEQLADADDRPSKDCFACHSHHTLATNPHR